MFVSPLSGGSPLKEEEERAFLRKNNLPEHEEDEESKMLRDRHRQMTAFSSSRRDFHLPEQFDRASSNNKDVEKTLMLFLLAPSLPVCLLF